MTFCSYKVGYNCGKCLARILKQRAMALGVPFLHNVQGTKVYKQILIANMYKDFYEALYNTRSRKLER